jgi:proteasome lid subunit RPN8/RPN11
VTLAAGDRPLTLPPGALAVLRNAAVREFPRECCGFILAGGIRPARNVIDELHERDGAEFVRTARTGYALGVADALFLDASFDTDDPVIAMYHSHPNGRAYFSAEDEHRALIDGRPVYPSLDQVVVGVDDDGVREIRAFRFAAGRFAPIPLRFADEPGAGLAGAQPATHHH